MASYQLKYPSVVESEGHMLEAVERLLSDNGVSEQEFHDFLLVVSEGFTNALIHGNCNRPDKEIRLNICINADSLSADIIDQGKGGLEKIRDKHPPSLLSEGGRGIDVMQHYATSVKFGVTSEGGLKVAIELDRKNGKRVEQITDTRDGG